MRRLENRREHDSVHFVPESALTSSAGEVL